MSGFRDDPSPPYNIEVEQALLGMVMHDPSELHEVLRIITPEDFFRDAHQVVMEAIKDRYDAGSKVDFMLVAEDVERSGKLKAVGGDEAFEEMSRLGVISCNAKEYAGVVKNHSTLRKMSDFFGEMRRECLSRKFSGDEMLSKAQSKFLELTQGVVRDETVATDVVIDEAWQLLMSRADGEILGVTTGLTDLDHRIGCLSNATLTILAARPSQGKSSLAMNICEHNAINLDIPVLFISLEMVRRDLGIRLLASQARVSGGTMRGAHRLVYAPECREDLDRLIGVRQKLKKTRLYVNHTPGRTVTQIGANVRSMQAQHDIKLVVIDYLSLIKMHDREHAGENRQESVARTCRQLKELAMTTNLPFLVLCQLNRALENRTDKRPQMSDLRESGQIEQDADIILLLHNPSKYNPTDRPGEADVLIAKNRCGETGCAQLAFFKELTRFDNLARPTTVSDWNAEPF